MTLGHCRVLCDGEIATTEGAVVGGAESGASLWPVVI
jgi:hypothetical protein